MTVDGRDITNMIADVEATSWRLRETIRVRELAATHPPGQMLYLLILEEQKAWRREAGFDYIETAAEMDATRSRSNFINPRQKLSCTEICLFRDAHILPMGLHLK